MAGKCILIIAAVNIIWHFFFNEWMEENEGCPSILVFLFIYFCHSTFRWFFLFTLLQPTVKNIIKFLSAALHHLHGVLLLVIPGGSSQRKCATCQTVKFSPLFFFSLGCSFLCAFVFSHPSHHRITTFIWTSRTSESTHFVKVIIEIFVLLLMFCQLHVCALQLHAWDAFDLWKLSWVDDT